MVDQSPSIQTGVGFTNLVIISRIVTLATLGTPNCVRIPKLAPKIVPWKAQINKLGLALTGSNPTKEELS
jgi:hypothetical protein